MTDFKINNDIYQTPPDSIFNDIKEKSIEVWKTYDNTYGYVDDKLERIEPITNFKDNRWTMVGMFDIHNQTKLSMILSKESNEFVGKKMLIASHEAKYNPFYGEF